MSRRLLTILALGLTALTTLTACNGLGPASQQEPDPEATTRARASASPVMASTALPTAVATLPLTYPDFISDKNKNIVLSIASVHSAPTGTILRFWINPTSDKNSMLVLSSDTPEFFPTLTDTTGKTYKVDTFFSDKNGRGKPRKTCICSSGGSLGPNGPYYLDASYPPLPDSVTTVDITLPGAKGSVNVPVTR